MLVEQVDALGLEPLQRRIGDGADVFGPAVHAALLAGLGIDREAELGGNLDLLANRRQRIADQLLVRERSIDLRGVEKGHPSLDRGPDQRNALLLVEGLAIAEIDPHASEADRGYFEPALSKLARLH